MFEIYSAATLTLEPTAREFISSDHVNIIFINSHPAAGCPVPATHKAIQASDGEASCHDRRTRELPALRVSPAVCVIMNLD